jgi:hypothetical protein
MLQQPKENCCIKIKGKYEVYINVNPRPGALCNINIVAAERSEAAPYS